MVTALTDTAAQDKPAAYFDPTANAWVYRMSAASGCSKAIILARTGTDGELPPEWMQQRFDDGHLHEPDILARVQREIGQKVFATDPATDDQWRVEIEVLPATEDHPKVLLRGHLDGLTWPLTNEESRSLVEAKAFAVSTWDKWKTQRLAAFPYYQTQLSLYMHAADVDHCYYGVKNKNTGDVDIVEFTKAEIATPPFDIDTILTRLRVIEGQARRHHIPQTCDVKQFPCPMWRHHEDDNYPESVDDVIASAFGDLPDDLDDESATSLDLLCAQYDQARSDQKDAEERKKDIARRIVEQHMKGGEVDKIQTTAWTVSMKDHTYRFLDEAEMTADGIDLEMYRRERKTQYPNVTSRRRKKK